SPAPDFETVRPLVQLLDTVDTSSPAVQKEFQFITDFIRPWAAHLVTVIPAGTVTAEELDATTIKLRYLSTPSIRRLLADESLESRVAVARFAYARALWNTTL